MDIQLFKYKKFPNNPTLKPNIFQDKYFIRSLSCQNNNVVIGYIIDFLMKMDITFGDNIDYDWDRKEDHNLNISKNVLINKNFSKLDDEIRNLLRFTLKDIDLRQYVTNDNCLWETFFADSYIEYEGFSCHVKNQISCPMTGFYNPTIHPMTYNFKIIH